MIRVFKNSILKIFLILTLSVEIFAFHISSTAFEQRIDTGGYMEYILKNESNKPLRYKIEIKENDRGADMSKWVNIYPKVVTIPPMQERVLKMYAQSPAKTKPGEYGFKMMITPLSIPTISDSNGNIQINSSVDFVPIIYMYGHVGDPKFNEKFSIKAGKFERDSKTGKLKFSATFENKSYAGADIGIKFISNTGTAMFGKWLGRIGKNSKNEFVVELSERIKKETEIKKIIIYNAVTLEDIKEIEMKDIK